MLNIDVTEIALSAYKSFIVPASSRCTSLRHRQHNLEYCCIFSQFNVVSNFSRNKIKEQRLETAYPTEICAWVKDKQQGQKRIDQIDNTGLQNFSQKCPLLGFWLIFTNFGCWFRIRSPFSAVWSEICTVASYVFFGLQNQNFENLANFFLN